MNISKENLLRINGGFGGGLISDAGIDFALQKQENKKLGPYKKLAYLWRAILVDRPFTHGNKRTAVFLAFVFGDEQKKQVDRDLILYHAISVASKNLTNIRQIEWRLKNAIR